MNEFSLIQHFFQSIPLKRKDVFVGIGDDAACLTVPPGMKLIVSTDTLVSGVHFLQDWEGYDIACKAVRVNVSDMAAMAAEPCWITLALTLPKSDTHWLESFSNGLRDSLEEFNIDLVGGDTTKGPLAITLTVFGVADQDAILRRQGAKPGDVILVSGQLGAAALAIKLLDNNNLSDTDRKELNQKLHYPKPRVDLSSYLRDYASSAIDISDGLSADLNHVCEASGVGACINAEAIPVHPLLYQYWEKEALDLALTGGDDYELCFTVPSKSVLPLTNALKEAGLVCYPIGVIEEEKDLRLKKVDGTCEKIIPRGYLHF